MLHFGSAGAGFPEQILSNRPSVYVDPIFGQHYSHFDDVVVNIVRKWLYRGSASIFQKDILLE